jgi:hypothetical protein
MLNRNPMLNKALLPAFWQYSVVRSFFSRLWNCRIWKFHKWTCSHEQGIKPTKEQLENGIEGFYDYAKMYCEICGTESKLSKQIRCKYKN